MKIVISVPWGEAKEVGVHDRLRTAKELRLLASTIRVDSMNHMDSGLREAVALGIDGKAAEFDPLPVGPKE